jgi:steroid delta-isomerase-like uncharacterized protein
MEPIEMVKQMCEQVYGQGKTELIAQLVADDVVSHHPILGTVDRAGIEADVKGYRKAFPDMTVQVIDAIGSGDKAMVRWRATGTHRGELMGTQPTNKKVTIDGMSEVRVQNGKIRESWDQYDVLGMLKQIGAIPESMLPRSNGGARAGGPSQQQPRPNR